MRRPLPISGRVSNAFLVLALFAPAVDAFCESKFGGMFRPGTEGGVEVGKGRYRRDGPHRRDGPGRTGGSCGEFHWQDVDCEQLIESMRACCEIAA